ncbi:hypothetical protein NDU88_005106 [Pleurodeles waltl]|uniref:Uncharacterized protein n=1 Tax=Pleurodeles waltl TaxID=8319 RepID=A0AAV7LKF8_PLEWA|nr:hypothetical protein NDU88_005106 [Pleurodeles waltl]
MHFYSLVRLLALWSLLLSSGPQATTADRRTKPLHLIRQLRFCGLLDQELPPGTGNHLRCPAVSREKDHVLG